MPCSRATIGSRASGARIGHPPSEGAVVGVSRVYMPVQTGGLTDRGLHASSAGVDVACRVPKVPPGKASAWSSPTYEPSRGPGALRSNDAAPNKIWHVMTCYMQVLGWLVGKGPARV